MNESIVLFQRPLQNHPKWHGLRRGLTYFCVARKTMEASHKRRPRGVKILCKYICTNINFLYSFPLGVDKLGYLVTHWLVSSRKMLIGERWRMQTEPRALSVFIVSMPILSFFLRYLCLCQPLHSYAMPKFMSTRSQPFLRSIARLNYYYRGRNKRISRI